MSGTAQRRKRGVSGSPLIPRVSAKSSREANSRRTAPPGANTEASASGRMASRAQSRRRSVEEVQQPNAASETIDADSVEEVVDLTCEASESSVVDLTSNDSVMLVDEGPQNRLVATGESYIVSSDEDEDTPPVSGVNMALQANSLSRSTPGTISCPVCLDSYSEIVESGRLVVSTRCGHVFCSRCLKDALSLSHSCPTCRKKLNTPPVSGMNTALQANSLSRSTPGTISCPVCLDSYSEIMESGRLVVSTRCGHVFCSRCVKDALGSSHSCPTCRKKLTTPPVSAVNTALQANSLSRSTPGTISCPVCLDSYSEIVESGRLVVSTRCGHVFCSQCVRDALSSSHSCPICRKRLTTRQYHPLYI